MNNPVSVSAPSRGASTPALEGKGLTLSYDHREISRGLDVVLPEGKVSVIIGPNACGKSTLLRALSRLLTPKAGEVLLHGQPAGGYAPKELARRLGLLPQSSTAPYGITVGDLVARGRFPHQKMLRQWSQEDEEAVVSAMRATGVLELAGRSVDELSGGQRQRVWVAMLFAQDTPVMLLDEPTTFLDVTHQLDVLELCRSVNQERARTVVIVLHDLNQACRFADHLIVMKDGAVVATGSPDEVMSEQLLLDVYGLRSRIITDPVFGTPLVVPIGSLHR